MTITLPAVADVAYVFIEGSTFGMNCDQVAVTLIDSVGVRTSCSTIDFSATHTDYRQDYSTCTPTTTA